jgi:rhamnogalacturonyl hydrolase YesR
MSELILISDSIKKLDDWISKNDWKAYDPFDGLSASAAKLITFNNHYLRIIWQQSVRRFPFNLRPLLGIKKQTGSKGMGFCALGYLKMYQATHKKEYLEKVQYCLDWLIKNYSKGFSGYCWGNHFSYESRGGKISKGLPTIVWTSLISNVFLDAYEALDEPAYLDVAKSAGDFTINDIGRYIDSEETLCFMYTPSNKGNPEFRRAIHNSNVLAGSLLARLYRHTGDRELLSLAKKSIYFTLKRQLSKGEWYYGEPKKYQWVDSFHTGYVLESIYAYMNATGDRTVEEKLVRGYQYFISAFFKEDGIPNYYDYKTYPHDIQCASQGIQTLVNLREYDESSLDLAVKVALWTIKHMQDPKGYFYFRKYPFITNKTPMFHWGQATMLAALGALFKVIKEKDG